MSDWWPSKNVARGGILQPAKTSYSPETQKFLKLLIDESKLSMMQRKKLDYYLRSGKPLPKPGRLSDSESSRSESCLTPLKKAPHVSIRPGSSKRRSIDTIVKSGAYEREKFVPLHPQVDREKEKTRLVNRLVYGQDLAPPAKVAKKKTQEAELGDVEENRFDQLVREIKEREDWLAQMEELGEGDKHKVVIQQQIQARVREMEKLSLL